MDGRTTTLPFNHRGVEYSEAATLPLGTVVVCCAVLCLHQDDRMGGGGEDRFSVDVF